MNRTTYYPGYCTTVHACTYEMTVGLLSDYYRTTIELLSDYYRTTVRSLLSNYRSSTVGLSDDCQTTVGRLSADDCRTTVRDDCRVSADDCRTTEPTVGRLSDCRTTVRRDGRSTVGALSEYCRRTVGVLSEYCRSTVGVLYTVRKLLSPVATVGRSDCRSVGPGIRSRRVSFMNIVHM